MRAGLAGGGAPAKITRVPERKRGKPGRKDRAIRRALKAAGFDWYILRVQPAKEHIAEGFLHDRGLDLFLPCDKKLYRVSRYSRRRQERHVPVMPGYLFVGFEAGKPVRYDALRLRLVIGVVGCEVGGGGTNAAGAGARPYRMPTVAMERLIADFPDGLRRADSVELMRKDREFHKGDRVRAAEGPFADYTFTAGETVDDTVLCEAAGLGTVRLPLHVLVPA